MPPNWLLVRRPARSRAPARHVTSISSSGPRRRRRSSGQPRGRARPRQRRARACEPGVASAAGGEVAGRPSTRPCACASQAARMRLSPRRSTRSRCSSPAAGRHGHTELLQEMTGSPLAVTVFLLDSLRGSTSVVTSSLRQAIDAIRAEAIADMLVRFAEVAPQLGLTARGSASRRSTLHAGGRPLRPRGDRRDRARHRPRARARNRCRRPGAADSIFHLAAQGRFDAVLGLYHDQVAAVMKSMDFHRVVSVTLGLPFLRFSVDHGTAYDIARSGIADPRNMETVPGGGGSHGHASRDTGSVQE